MRQDLDQRSVETNQHLINRLAMTKPVGKVNLDMGVINRLKVDDFGLNESHRSNRLAYDKYFLADEYRISPFAEYPDRPSLQRDSSGTSYSLRRLMMLNKEVEKQNLFLRSKAGTLGRHAVKVNSLLSQKLNSIEARECSPVSSDKLSIGDNTKLAVKKNLKTLGLMGEKVHQKPKSNYKARPVVAHHARELAKSVKSSNIRSHQTPKSSEKPKRSTKSTIWTARLGKEVKDSPNPESQSSNQRLASTKRTKIGHNDYLLDGRAILRPKSQKKDVTVLANSLNRNKKKVATHVAKVRSDIEQIKREVGSIKDSSTVSKLGVFSSKTASPRRKLIENCK